MARTGPKNSARRVLTWLGAIFVVLTAVLAGGVISGHASWAPKLALDLEGGTQMILAPRVEGSSEITEEQLNQAVAIIRQRVDGSGVAEAEISTQSGRNVVVSLPGTPSKETRDLIQASADMNFRPVIAAADPAAIPVESRTPDDKLPKPTAEPTNASDTNWVTPEVYKEFEALDCVNPSTEKRDRSDPAKPLVTCEPATDKTPAIKYILGPVEVKGQDISSSSFSQVQGAQGSVTNSWGVNITFNAEATAKFKEVTERLNQFYTASLAQGGNDPKAQFAIVLDDKVISAPRSLAVITDGKPQITGNFTQALCKGAVRPTPLRRFADLLRDPVPGTDLCHARWGSAPARPAGRPHRPVAGGCVLAVPVPRPWLCHDRFPGCRRWLDLPRHRHFGLD
ncbi:hypothetical protein StoSoilB13_09870 [Arthrobacter sp. StoSoilB13]|nr:hypothetical protein StoSoilB13_09870 [Arthrobacter sp. StoSoilB13]